MDYYEGGYKLLTTRLNGDRILIVPKHQQAPEDAEALVSPSAEGEPGKLIVLQEPVKNLYLVASSVMDMFAQLDSMDAISMCGLKEEDWYIPAAKQAMKDGTLLYAGKYSQPDYELLLSQNCSMAIENSMIYHTPEVMEKLWWSIPAMRNIPSGAWNGYVFSARCWIRKKKQINCLKNKKKH